MATAAKKASPKAGGEKNLSDLFEHGLKDIYYAEKKIFKSLPKMIKAAEDPKLKEGLSSHREETAQQIKNLESVFEILGKRPKGQKCDAIEGILQEGESLLDDFGGTKTGDAAIIFSCQAVEHYEITRYGSMYAYATAMGLKDVAKIIAGILAQEKKADADLSKIAESRVNHAAKT